MSCACSCFQAVFTCRMSFFCSVCCIILTEYLVLSCPEYFPHYYVILTMFSLSYRSVLTQICQPSLLLKPLKVDILIEYPPLSRYTDYSARRSQLLMLDHPYIINISVVIQTCAWPGHQLWYKVSLPSTTIVHVSWL